MSFNIWIDPGIGFSKINGQNFELLRGLDSLQHHFENPVLIGASKKSFLRNTIGTNTMVGDMVVSAYCFSKGVNILRVHDVVEVHKARFVAEQLFCKAKASGDVNNFI